MAGLGLTLIACGCGSGQPSGNGVLLLGWSFIDGRQCADSGVELVVVSEDEGGELLSEAICPAGFGAPTIRLTLHAGEHRLRVSGLSAEGTPLYDARLTVEISPGLSVDRVVELAFTGGM